MSPAEKPPSPPSPARKSPPPIPRPAEQARLRKVFHSALQGLEGTPAERSTVGAALLECVSGDPGNLLFLEAFLRHLRESPPAATTWSDWWRGRPKFEAFVAAGDWNVVWREGYAYLQRQPQDVLALAALAAAAEAGEWEEIELRLLRYADQTAPKDPVVVERIARALTRRGELEEAVVWWERVPSPAAERFLEVYRATGLPAFDPVIFPSEDAPDEDAEFSVHVAALRFAEAERGLAEFSARTGSRRQLEERADRLNWLRARHALAVAEVLLADSLTTSNTVARLRTDVARRELDLLNRRANRSPRDVPLRIELALRHRRLGNFSAAVQTLEAFSADPRAALELGEVRQQLRQFDEALALYAKSIAAAEGDVLRRAMDRGVRLAEALGKSAEAAAWRERARTLS